MYRNLLTFLLTYECRRGMRNAVCLAETIINVLVITRVVAIVFDENTLNRCSRGIRDTLMVQTLIIVREQAVFWQLVGFISASCRLLCHRRIQGTPDCHHVATNSALTNESLICRSASKNITMMMFVDIFANCIAERAMPSFSSIIIPDSDCSLIK